MINPMSSLRDAYSNQPAGVYLVIQDGGRQAQKRSVAFEMQGGFQTGYENQFDIKIETKQTHPQLFNWKSSKVSPFSVELDLAVGVQRLITTPGQLSRVVEMLYDFALPKNGVLSSVIVSVQGGIRPWFKQRAFLGKVGVTWQPPYDVETGQSLSAKVSLSFEPTYATDTGVSSNRKSQPKSPWKFANQIGGGSK